MNRLIAVAALIVLVMVAAPAAMAASYSMTLKTDASSYSGAQTLTASGVITPAPGPNTAVFVEILSPSQTPLAVASALVDPSTGAFSHAFILGGSARWVAGTYTLNATWGNSAVGPTATNALTFTYTPTVTTTTTTPTTTTSSTTTTTATTTTPTTTTRTTTTTSTTSTTSTTTPPPTTTTTTSTTTTPTATSSTSSSTTSAGGVPEFPFQALAVVALTVLLVGSYAVLRRRWVPRTVSGRATDALRAGGPSLG